MSTGMNEMAAYMHKLFTDTLGCPVYRRGFEPMAEVPRASYTVMGGTTQPVLSGGAANHRRARVSFTVFAETQIEAVSMVEAVISKATTVVAGKPVRAIDVEYGPYDLPEPLPGAERMLPAVSVDFGVTYAYAAS